MYIITKEGVQSLEERIRERHDLKGCQDELKKIIEIKEALSWRSQFAQCCCGGCGIGWDLAAHLDWEIQVLNDALTALERGDANKASLVLGDYTSRMEQ